MSDTALVRLITIAEVQIHKFGPEAALHFRFSPSENTSFQNTKYLTMYFIKIVLFTWR